MLLEGGINYGEQRLLILLWMEGEFGFGELSVSLGFKLLGFWRKLWRVSIYFCINLVVFGVLNFLRLLIVEF